MRLPGPLARGRRTGTRRELVVSVTIAVVVLLLVGGVSSFAASWVARGQALDDAERRTSRLSEVIGSKVAAVLANESGAEQTLRDDIALRLNPRDLTNITIWRPDGTIVLSRDPAMTDVAVPPSAEMLEAVRTGEVVSDFDEDGPEADADGAVVQPTTGGTPRFVEVYVPMEVTGQGTVVLEAYFSYVGVEDLARKIFVVLLPLVLVPLLLVQAIQLPMAVSLARRVRRHEKERTALLEEALSVSDRERVRFASDLHDGPIQDLAGISYALGAIAPTVPERHGPLMGRVEDALQRAIRSLRGLMTDLYPPDLRTDTFEQAVESLAAPLRSEGVETVVALDAVPTLSDEAVGALYRVARESLANVGKHAQATTVSVTLEKLSGGRGEDDLVRLSIADDGVGLDLASTDKRAEGHLGLRLISDRVAALGGALSIESAPGQGTTVVADLPLTAGLRA